jgi:hypothetical protein
MVLKEHNPDSLRDTSGFSYPSNDWRILIISSAHGGKSYFAISDVDARRTPFMIEAGAKTLQKGVAEGDTLLLFLFWGLAMGAPGACHSV